MKLHLPTRLRAAVLACITAVAALATTVGTGALTTGVVAYTIAASEASAADPVIETDATLGASEAFEPGNSTPYAYDHVTIGSSGVSKTIVAGGMFFMYANRLDGAGNITLNRTHNGGNLTLLWLDGDCSGYTGTVSLAAGTSQARNIHLGIGGNGTASGAVTLSNATLELNWIVMDVQQNATIKTLSANNTQIAAVNLETLPLVVSPGSGSTGKSAWENVTSIASAEVARELTLTNDLTLTDSSVYKGITLKNQGTNSTISGGTISGKIINEEGATLTLSGTIKLEQALTNNGTMAFMESIKFDLSALTPAEGGIYTLVEGTVGETFTSLGVANILNPEAGYTYQFNDDGTVQAILSSTSLVWNGGAEGTWDDTSENWLDGSTATDFDEMDSVTFATPGARISTAGNHDVIGMTLEADTVLAGAGDINAQTITGGSHKLTIEDGVKVTVTTSSENLNLAGSGKYAPAFMTNTDQGIGATLTDDWTGTLVIGGGEQAVETANFNFNNYSKPGSTVELNGMKGYLNGGANEFSANIVLTDNGTMPAMEVNNGYTSASYTFNGAISGTGTWQRNGQAGQTYNFNGDLSGWTGVIKNTHASNSLNLSFAGEAATTSSNLTIENGYAVLNLKSDATLKTIKVIANGSVINVDPGKTINLLDTAQRAMNATSYTINLGEGSVINDAGYLGLTNITLRINGAGTYNVAGICSALNGSVVGNVNIGAGSTLHITGTQVSAEAGQGAFMLSNYPASSVYNINGALISEAGISSRDGTGTLNVHNGGLLQLNAGFVTSTARTNNATINVKEGGTLKVASTTTAYNEQIAVNLENGSTFEGTAVNTVIAQNLTISGGSAETTATANIKADTDTSLTLTGVISGDYGALNKTGEGTLVLSGANTYAGGTKVQGGTLDATGSIGAGDVSVGSGATIILHGQLDATKLTNNGTLEIASGFSGLEGAGITGIEGGAEGNGFNQGGETNIFKTTGTVEGTLSAVFNGGTVAIAEDGTLTLDDDWGTYHINNALLSTETFGTIKAAATAHSAVLAGIDFAAADQTLTIDADGFATSMVEGEQASTATLAVNDGQTIIVDTATLPALQLAEGGSATLALQNSASATISGITGGSTLNVTGTSSADTLTFDNGNINRVLNITDATVAAGNTDGTGFNTQATNVNAGGVLRLTGQDSLGWGGNAAGLITLAGTAENVATLALGARQTLKTNIAMNGNSVITAITDGDHSTPMLDPYGGTLTVTGTNNIITTGIRQRSSWDVTVDTDSTLVIEGSVLTREGGGSGGIVKKGEGTLTFSNASGTLQKYTADAGVTVLDNSTFEVGANMDLSHGDAARGIVKLQNSSALNFANAVNLWVNGTTSLEVDETSSVNFTRTDWSMNITGATEGTPAVIAGTKDAYYDLNDAVVISDAIVTASATADKTVSTKLTNSALVNNGSGTLTFSNSENTAFTSVDAHGGNITLSAATSIGSVTIAAGKTLTASAEGPLSISTALTAGAGSTLASALTIGNGAALDLVTGDNALSLGSNALTLGTGLTITEAMKSAIEALEADASLTLMKGVTSLTGGDIAATDVFTGLTGDYTIKVQDGNLVVNAAALPSAELTWEGSDGIWGEGTPWTSEGGASAYVEGATVTINGATPGIITVQGEQTAKNVTVATTGYTIKRADTGTNSLTIQGNLIVNEDVTLNLGFMPTVNGGIVLNDNSVLDMSTAIPYIAADSGATGASFADMLAAVSGTGKVQMTGDVKVQLGGGSAASKTAQTFATDFSVDGMLKLQNWQNETTWTLAEGKTLDVTGDLWMSNKQTLALAAGSTVNAGTLHLGMHEPGGEYKGILTSTDATINVGHIIIEGSNAETAVTITGGDVTITDTEAFAIAGVTKDAATVSVSGATIKTGTGNDTTWNHDSTLTGVTLEASEGHSITVGGENMTTNVVTGLTANGTVTMAGTTAVAGAATITDNGTLTIDSLAGAEGSNVTLAGTGTTTITGGTADTLTAGKDATVGDLTVKTLTGTGTLTQTTGTTLTMADGGTLSGSVTTGAITAAGSLAKTGTDTVTTGDITGASTALTVSGGTLSSGAVTVASAEVATGATLTSSGKLTTTGALTLNGAANAASADIASIIMNEGGSLACTGDLKLGGLTLNAAGSTPGITAASLSSESLNITATAEMLGALAMGAGDSLTIVGLTSQYTNGLTLNGSSDATLDAFGYKYTVESTADGIVITKADAGIVWTGGADDEWGKGGNWQGGGIPTGDDVSASFTGKGVGDVNISTDGVTIGQVIVTSHDAAAGTKSEYTFKKGELTITDDMKVLDGHVIIGTTVAATDVTIIPTSDTAVSSVTVNGEGALSVSGTLAVESETDTTTGSLTIQEGGFAGIHTLASSTADVALGGTLAVEEGVIKKLTEESGTKGNLVVGSMVATMSLTPVVPDEVIILEDSEIDTLLVTGTGNLTTKGDLTAETSTDVAGTVTAEKNLTTGAMGVTSTGDVTVGSAAAPATLDVATLENAGTVTVYNTMKASTSVENTDTGTLDIKGELQAADASVENSKTLTVGGALAADTLTTNSGATTEAKGGATIGTSLDNHGTTTVTGNLVSADTTTTAPGSAIITNDATGTGEKLVVTGNVSGASLTTDTDATTEIGGTATLADGLTNNGTTTITGATTLGGTTENTGTLATGALTAETLNNEGTLNVTGNATVKDLSSATASSLTDVSGTLTIAEGGSLSDAGDITASALDLSNLAATDKATVGNLKTNAVTLNGLSSATTGLTVETLAAKTPGQKVTVSVADSIVDQLAALEENDTAQLVTVTDAASTGKLQLTTAAAGKIANELDKKLLTYTISDNGVLTVLDNSFDKDMTLSGNAQAGMDMATEAYLAAGGTPTGALKDVTDALKTYRAEAASADPAVAAAATSAAERLTTALSGSSIAAMGSALSGDVERQLRAIRNRTTTMGVNQAVINEGMPYYNAWVNAEGDYRKVAADGTMAGYKMMSWGGTVGMDVDVTPSFTCGLAATAMYGDFDADSTDSATGDLNTYYVSAFARYAKHRWTHTFVATAGMADTSLERTIEGHKVKGDSTGVMFGGMYEVGYVFALDKEATTCLQPVLNVSFTHASLSGYDEDGANIGLSAGDTEFNKLTVGLGARLQSVIGENIYNRSSILEARAMVKFDAGDRQGETKVSFAGAGLPTHTVKSSETGAVGAEFGVGLTVPVGGEGGNLFMDASAEIRAEYTNVNATVGYRINF